MKNALANLKAAAWSALAALAVNFDQLKESGLAVKVAAVAAGAYVLSACNAAAQEILPFYGAVVSKVRGKLHEFFADSAD